MTGERRTCVIHIGTHKTGTTALQYFLMQNSAELESRGLLFPKTGWYGVVPGHHAVAWELAYQQGGPVFRALLDEIAASDADTVVLSAEDFSLFGSRPDALKSLATSIREIGYQPKLLVYFRPQGPFAESMYVERVKHDFIRPIADFIHAVVSTGRYEAEGILLPLEFRYSRMLAAFADAFGAKNILARVYAGSGDVALIFNDFLSAVTHLSGWEQGDMRLPITHPTINESLSFAHLLGTVFSRLNPDVPVPSTAEAFVAEYAPDLPKEYINQRFALFSRNEHREILASVAEDNELVNKQFGIHIPFVQETDILSAINSVWAKALIERKIYDRSLKAWRRA